MSPVKVSIDNFARAESDRMFAAIQDQAGGVNHWQHTRTPTPVDQQTVIRMNRDTLYGTAIVDISKGATVTVPDAGDRLPVCQVPQKSVAALAVCGERLGRLIDGEEMFLLGGVDHLLEQEELTPHTGSVPRTGPCP